MRFSENTLVGNMWVQNETECLRSEKKGDESKKVADSRCRFSFFDLTF